MKPRREVKRQPKAADVRTAGHKPQLRIVKLEERITPKLATNHNETMVFDPNETMVYPTETKPTAAEPGEDAQRTKPRIIKLEERIAPRPISSNHNESLVRDR